MTKTLFDIEVLDFFLTLTTCASSLLSLIYLKKLDKEEKK